MTYVRDAIRQCKICVICIWSAANDAAHKVLAVLCIRSDKQSTCQCRSTYKRVESSRVVAPCAVATQMQALDCRCAHAPAGASAVAGSAATSTT